MGLLSGSSRVLWLADSITAGFAGSAELIIPVGVGLRQRFVSNSNRFAASNGRVLPVIDTVLAAAGRAYGDVSATMASTLAAMHKQFTHFVIQLGVNDASNIHNGSAPTIDLATFTAQMNTTTAAMIAHSPGCKIVLVGPWTHGFAHDIDTEIAQVAGVLQAKAAANPGVIYFVDVSSVSNLGGNSGDGTHPTTQGAVALSVPILAVL